ncbi:GNAT family N-acetyltransferase [Pseudoalteromonas sp. SSDWG2]|uniref:GNAT family N-acetyltransferase n=1 Tax=Pseudoalteromonas sp. SSDWG2 TaxID=3139391 RepID=UPI003BA91953
MTGKLIMFTSEQLAFTPLEHAHWPLFLALHNDQKAMQYVGDVKPEHCVRAKFEHRLVTNVASAHSCWVISQKRTNEDIGVIGFERVADDAAELGYMLLSQVQGRGYGTEALGALLLYSREHLGISRLLATVTQGNEASKCILMKHGFKQLETINTGYRIGGKVVNDWRFELCINAQK